jgi:tRNA1(Val) A37 N6-methylase TrmN6
MSKVYTHDLLAYDGLKILQRNDLFKFSIDALLLGDFVKINQRAKQIIDLGCGLGPVSLYLSLKTRARIIGVDIQKDVIELARKSVLLNHLENQIEMIQGDIREIYKHFETNQFDVVVCNPPFYKTNEVKQQNNIEALSIARHEIMLNLDDLLQATKRLLSQGGMFYMIHRADRMDEIIVKLHQHHFVVKRLRLVYSKPNKPAKMLLIEARYNGSMGSLEIEEPLYIYDENTEYTKEIKTIFHLGDEGYEKNTALSK